MAKTDYKTIEEYHVTFPPEVRRRLEQIRAIIKKEAPEAEEVISYQIPAFKIGKKFLVYYAAFSKHLTLSSPWTEALLTEFEGELQNFKVTKSVIQFPLKEDLPVELIQRIVAFRKIETVR